MAYLMSLTGNGNLCAPPTNNAATDTANVNAVLALGGLSLFPPSPAANTPYRLNPITIPKGAQMKGVGAGGYGIESDDTRQTHFALANGANGHMFTLPVGCSNVLLEDIYLDGNKNNQTAAWNGIHATDASSSEQLNLRLNRIHIEAASGYGVYAGVGRRDIKANIIESLYNEQAGISVYGPDTVWNQCLLGSNGTDNIQVGAAVCRIRDCDIWGAGAAGINLLEGSASGVVIGGCGIDRNANQGIVIGSGDDSILINGNIFHSNSQAGNYAYSHIEVNSSGVGGCGSAVIDGNGTFVDSGITNVAEYFVKVGSGAVCQMGGMNRVIAGSCGSLTNSPYYQNGMLF
jgi:hypothetical protein